jgi:exopolyphosphatase / guanosine-5'-triphosphate,3'-diphosphate pyrophosphatase
MISEGPPAGSPVAAYDCGTNSTRLLVVDGSGRTLDRQMRITRLGKGVDSTGKLAPQSIERTVAVLADYKRRADELGVVRARLVATSAARDSANAEEFFSAAEKATGLRPELLSGDEEGRLSFAGATAALPEWFPSKGALLVVDIGGGSTELVVGEPSAPAQATAVSIEIGCVRVTERFLAHDPPTAAEVDEASRVIGHELETARARLPVLEAGGPVIGLAGTVSTLASLELSLAEYDRQRLHHAVLSRGQVDRWLAILSSESSAARLARPGMVAGREDVIVAGILVLSCVMAVFDRSSCLASEDDILDGLVKSMG